MKNIQKMTKINSDIFNISKRVQKIYKNTQIYYDFNTKKYFLCEKENIIFTLPFNQLDNRVLNFLRERKAKTNQEILDEIEKYNQKIFQENKEKIKQSAIDCAEKNLRRS